MPLINAILACWWMQIKIPPYPANCVNGVLVGGSPAPSATTTTSLYSPLSSGLNATFILTGMSKAAFLSDGLVRLLPNRFCAGVALPCCLPHGPFRTVP